MTRILSMAVLLATAGCAATAVRPDGASWAAPGTSRVIVLLREPSPSATTVPSRLEAAFALGEDGSRFPLAMSPVRTDTPPGAERLWLSGPVPPGTYQGIEVVPAGEAGAEPTEPIRGDIPFVVTKASGVVLVATFPAPGALEVGVRSRPAAGLYGLATVGEWDALALFDKRSGALASVLPIGRGPAGIAIDSQRLRAYVAVSGEDQVAIVDLPEGRVRDRVILRTGDSPRDVVVTPDGQTLLVANAGSDTVSFVDTASASEIERVAVAGRPVSLLLDPRGARAFVLGERSSVVAVLGVAARIVVGSVAVEAGPVQARFAGRNNETILVIHADSPYLSVIDAATLTVAQRVYVGSGARALAVDSRSGRIYLARRKTGRIEVFDPNSFLPMEEIRVPGEVSWLSVEAEGNGLGVLLGDAGEVRIVGLVGGRVQASTPLGADAAALAFVQGGSGR